MILFCSNRRYRRSNILFPTHNHNRHKSNPDPHQNRLGFLQRNRRLQPIRVLFLYRLL